QRARRNASLEAVTQPLGTRYIALVPFAYPRRRFRTCALSAEGTTQITVISDKNARRAYRNPEMREFRRAARALTFYSMRRPHPGSTSAQRVRQWHRTFRRTLLQ